MSLPWGVKDFIEPSASEAFKNFIADLVETELSLPSGYVAKILKADVKEKKEKFLMIMRYQLTTLQ